MKDARDGVGSCHDEGPRSYYSRQTLSREHILTPINSELTEIKTKSIRDKQTFIPVKCKLLRNIYIDDTIKLIQVLYIM